MDDRIERIETFLVGSEWTNYLIVRLTTVGGVTGLGEATMQYLSRPVQDIVGLLFTRYVEGRSAWMIEHAVREMYRGEYARGGPALNSAIAGIEMAMWDICGKSVGRPVYDLLGGRVRDHIPAYANGWFGVSGPKEDLGAAAAEVERAGYAGAKFDPFWGADRDPGEDEIDAALDRVSQVAEATGRGFRVMVDAHGRFSVGAAGAIAPRLAEAGVHWFEEPVDPENFDALGRLPRVPGMQIATGERCYSRYQVPELIRIGGPDILQPDIIQVGGILEARKIAAIADSHYLQVSFHNPFGPVATAAAVQLCACTTNVAVLESFCEFGPSWRSDLLENCPMPDDGRFRIHDRPGLGIELIDDVALAYPYNDAAYNNLWDSSFWKA